jgi:hypothetical protein
MESKHQGVIALYDFIDAFNSVKKNEIINKLHFPHYVHSNGNEITIYRNGEDFWKSLKVQFDQMIHNEHWHYSTLDKCEIINKSDKTVQCLVEFNRRTKNKKSYGTAKGLWIATFKNNLWALQVRSMIPVSGKISSIAGTKMD